MYARWIPLGLVFACGSPETSPPARDPSRVFEVKTHDRTYRDDPFDAEVVTQFRTTEVLADLDVRALAVAGEKVYAGTASGLFRLNDAGDRFDRLALARTSTAIIDLAPLDGGGVLALVNGAVVRVNAAGEEDAVFELPGRTLRAVAAADPAGSSAFAATDRGAVLAGASGVMELAGSSTMDVRDLALAGDGGLWVAASSGVYRYDRGLAGMTPHALAGEPRAIAGGDGEVWIASADSLTRARDGLVMRPERGGLPTADLRALAVGSGQLMIGHGIGASAVEGSRTEHYHSERWIPAEEVRAVAIGPGKTRWIATAAGVSRITYEPATLHAKAEIFEQSIEDIHIRMNGFVNDYVGFASPWDHSAGPMHWDNDNDGLWTEMQIGTWCFAYAVTKDERYYQRARRSLEVMFLQIDVPGEAYAAEGKPRGFISKSLVRDDEAAFASKTGAEGWRRQEFKGRTYNWKTFTSSDEYAGHYFGMPVYYDLCAKDEAEKEEIRSRLKLATDYVIAHGYTATNIDGMVLDHWDNLAAAVDGLDGCPEKHDLATCINSWGGGGWLNGIEVMGMLLATWHVTGDEYYYSEYERLHTDEKYGKLIPVTENTLTVSNPRFANHSDHELAMLAYFTMLRYEPNEDRREALVRSILDFYEWERAEHNPWQVATIGMAHAGDVDLAGAITSLRDIPLDRRDWVIDNSHRLDAGPWPVDRAGEPQFDTAFPYDEINCLKWNSGPYNVRAGYGANAVVSPTPYLIGYWMLRYAGLIE